MLYWLTVFSDGGDFFNLFRYITFRAGAAFFTALVFGFLFGRPLINLLRKQQRHGQPIREDGPESHLETKAGTGKQPTAASTVKAHYHGTLRDGSVFDSSVERGQPLEIGLNQVIPCWTEGIAMMKEGGKARLTCPSSIAYGERGSPGGIPPNAALTFEVELIEVVN